MYYAAMMLHSAIITQKEALCNIGIYSDGGLKSAGGRYRLGQVSRMISASLSGVF
jgi:hypothetical protein